MGIRYQNALVAEKPATQMYQYWAEEGGCVGEHPHRGKGKGGERDCRMGGR